MRSVFAPFRYFALISLFGGTAHTALATDLSEVLSDALQSDPKIGAARAGFLARDRRCRG